jgi:hypothetical protein
MKIGSKVVYIERNMPEHGLINGKIYTVLGIADCGTKGHGFAIDVGLNVPPNTWGVVCEVCGNIISIGDEYYLDYTGFIEVDENELLQESAVEEALALLN